ncbi:hypothetical protein SAMN04488112_1293 [Melghirimyces thermohalophilus]|uniref:Pre-toxin TG domain-containing protein n=2 Tax=Melghirimyces thermohalophilus TaxID=1236220 RepID=A0A1G6RKR0_9BACL|nr:hypothetical protein SAMN04488112_1293 [Melghirimyces thermohalophilus]
MPAPSNPDDGVNPDGGSTDKADDNENHPTPPAPPQEEEEGALEKIGKGTLDFLGYTDAKAAITGVDENGNKIGIGERILRGAMVLPIAKPVKGVKMVAKYGDDVLAAGKTKLDDVTRNWKKTACACPFSPHYKAAKEGGKHSGFYKQYVSKSDEQVKKGISSIQKQIEEHEDKIKNPTKYIPNFKELDPRQQQALLTKKWPSDIQRQKEQKTILEGILKERN